MTNPGQLPKPDWVMVGVPVDAGVRLYAARNLPAAHFWIPDLPAVHAPDHHLTATMADMIIITRPTYPECIAELQRIWAARDSDARHGITGKRALPAGGPGVTVTAPLDENARVALGLPAGSQPWADPDANPLEDIRQIGRDDRERTSRPFEPAGWPPPGYTDLGPDAHGGRLALSPPQLCPTCGQRHKFADPCPGPVRVQSPPPEG